MLSIPLQEIKAKLGPEVKLEAKSSYKYHFAQLPYGSVSLINRFYSPDKLTDKARTAKRLKVQA